MLLAVWGRYSVCGTGSMEMVVLRRLTLMSRRNIGFGRIGVRFIGCLFEVTLRMSSKVTDGAEDPIVVRGNGAAEGASCRD